MKRGVPTSIHLLGEQPLHDKKLAVSYLRFPIEALLLCNPLGHLPQAFEQKQGRFHCVRINEGRARVVCQAGSDCRVIAIRQTNDEVRIWASPDADKLYALTMQRMMRMSHRDPFLR
jgi:hypothetical protein